MCLKAKDGQSDHWLGWVEPGGPGVGVLLPHSPIAAVREGSRVIERSERRGHMALPVAEKAGGRVLLWPSSMWGPLPTSA